MQVSNRPFLYLDLLPYLLGFPCSLVQASPCLAPMTIHLFLELIDSCTGRGVACHVLGARRPFTRWVLGIACFCLVVSCVSVSYLLPSL